MKTAWIVGTAIAMLAVSVVLADEADRPAAETVSVPYYVRGPRIIHVPQAGEERATLPAPVPPRAAKTLPVKRTAEPAPPVRRKPYAASKPVVPQVKPEPLPPPTGPRRAVLSAPPPRAEPLRPTPRFGAPVEAVPAEPVIAAHEPPRDQIVPLPPPASE